MRALVYGPSGGLAQSLIKALTAHRWTVERASRSKPDGVYSAYHPLAAPDAVFFPQGLFVRKPLTEMSDGEIDQVLDVGFTDIVRTVRNLLAADTDPQVRRDYVFVGSTSAYAGFGGSAVYCATKHALLGLVKSLNDEYVRTNKRFWLFSMGTMNTAMGRMLTDQDASTFLDPDAVAERIVESLTAQDNLFEPEIVIRRRVVRMKEA